jgi:hypothetical protein
VLRFVVQEEEEEEDGNNRKTDLAEMHANADENNK